MPRTAPPAIAALAVLVAALVGGCESAPTRVIQVSGPTAVPSSSTSTPASEPPPTDPAPSAPASPATPPPPGDVSIDHVVAVSVDGLNPDALTELGPAGTPTFHRLIREGASTLNARTAREQTRTLPNHTGMLTGRRIDADEDGHGYTRNTDQGSTVENEAGRYVPSVFDVVHDRGGSTALFAAKEKFAVFERTWNRDGAEDETGRDDGSEKIDRFVVDTDDERLTDRVTSDLGRRPAQFTFVHLAGPDEAGHANGFMSARYLDAVQRADGTLGRIVAAIGDDPTLLDHTVLIVTADHGGRGADHDDAGDRDNYRIPFLTWGAGVAPGEDLYRLNPEYRDPGGDRSDYSGPQPIRNADLANLALGLLERPRVPGSEFDREQDLDLAD